MSSRRYDSPETVYDRWRNYGARYAVYRSLHDTSLAFASGPLQPNEQTTGNVPGLRDYSGRTAGAVWSVGAGDQPKYQQGNEKGQAFWASSINRDESTGLKTATSERIICPTVNASRTGPISMSVWCAFADDATYYHMPCTCGTDTGTRTGFFFYRNPAGKPLVEFGSGQGLAAGTTTVANREWRHWCGTWDGSNVRFYLDGNLEKTVAFTTGNVAAGAYISGTVAGDYLFPGLVASFSVHHRVLTPNEIATLAIHPLEAYEVEAPRPYLFGTTAGVKFSPWLRRQRMRMTGT